MPVDEELWEEVKQAVQDAPTDGFGFLGTVEGNEVWVVDGNEIKTRRDRPDDDPHMDFVEGGNDLEADWVRREHGAHVLLVDGRLDKECWPFVLYHEAYERRMMARGWSYAKAHEAANQGERQLRIADAGARAPVAG